MNPQLAPAVPAVAPTATPAAAPTSPCARRRPWLLVMLLGLLSMGTGDAAPAAPGAPARPNIVWILVDDMSANFSCYGETAIRTPNVDRLAAEGVRFTKAFVTGPICSISRSALMTGCYQTAIGGQNHRSGSAKHPIRLPGGMQPVPQLLRQAGYHTSNLSLDEFLREPGRGPVRIAKTDYNFVWDRAATYDTNHWAERAAGRPFFVQVQLSGGKYRGQKPGPQWPSRVQATLGSTTPTNGFTLPPWLPEDDVIRADWAQYLDTVRFTDWEVGRIVERLRAAGELDRTVIIFWTDHGISHVRTKQFLYDGGIHVPLVMRGPGVAAGRVRADMVEHIDIAAATVALAGLPIPTWMQARNLLVDPASPGAPAARTHVFSARDRADETVDRIRAVRSDRYKYIRNYFPNRPYLQPNRYKDDKAIVQAMRRLHASGSLNPAQALIMADTRPREELYDLQSDPHELKNLAQDPALAEVLASHRRALESWIQRTEDHGRTLEPEQVYLDYIYDDRPEGGRGNRNQVFDRNVELMQRWAKEKPMQP